MKKHQIIYLLTMLLATNAFAVELKAMLSPGYDSNPYKLADNLDNDESFYLDTNVSLKEIFGKFEITGRLNNRAYEGALDNADVFSGYMRGRYKTGHQLLNKKFKSELNVDYGFKDKTYVSRSTGTVGVFSGQKISDRYDYEYWKISGKSAIQLTKGIKTGLELTFQQKEYDDQNILGLSNLDYEQIGLTNSWKLKQSKASSYKLDLSIGERDFDNKRQKSISGALIAGSDLKYYFHKLKASHRHKITKNIKVDLALKYEERTDNGSGYYDTEELKLYADIDYKISKGMKAYVDTSYTDREYQNNTSSADENDQDEAGKKGYSIKLGLEKDLMLYESMPVIAFIGAQYDNYDSNDPIYEYERYQVFTGVKVEFGR